MKVISKATVGVALLLTLGFAARLWLKKSATSTASQVALSPSAKSTLVSVVPPPANSNAECKSQWMKLDGWELNQTFTESDLVDLSLLTSCGLSSQMIQKLRFAQSVCRKSVSLSSKYPDLGPGFGGGLCSQAIRKFLAELVAWASKERSMSEMSDRRVLISQIASNLNSSPSEAALAAERLLELEPDNRAAARAAYLCYLNLYSEQRKNSSNENFDNKLVRSLERLHMLVGEEYFIKDVEITSLLWRGISANQLKVKLKAFAEEFPEKGQPYYYYALANARTGNKQKSIELMKKALDKDPGNLSYQLVLAGLYSAKQPTDVRKVFDGLGFNFDERSLYGGGY